MLRPRRRNNNKEQQQTREEEEQNKTKSKNNNNNKTDTKNDDKTENKNESKNNNKTDNNNKPNNSSNKLTILWSSFRLCAKCGGGVEESSDSEHGSKCAAFNGVSFQPSAALNGSVQEGGPITVETLCQLARRQRDHSHPDSYNSER